MSVAPVAGLIVFTASGEPEMVVGAVMIVGQFTCIRSVATIRAEPSTVVDEAPVAKVRPPVAVNWVVADVIFIFPVVMVVAPTAIDVVPPVTTTPPTEAMPMAAHPMARAPQPTVIAPVSTRILAEVTS